MRTVEVYQWTRKTPIQKELIGTGVFHQWGHEQDGDESGPVAIVEMEDGTIMTPPACMVRFVK